MVRLRKFSLLIPFLFFLFNIILRSFGLEINSLAGDEPYSVYYAQMDIADILKHMRPGNNPPLYEIFLHFWEQWFGIDELAVRIPSLIFTGITAAFLYKIGNEFFSKSTGIIAGFLFSFSNYATYFSHEARVYALFGMLTCISFYFFLRWLNNRYTKKSMVLFCLVNALLLYAHYFGVMVIGVQVLLAVLFKLRDLKELRWFGLSVVVSMVLFLPYVSVVLEQFSITKEKGTWLQPPNGWSSIGYMLKQFVNSKKIVMIVLAIFGISVLINVRRLKSISKNTWVVLTWFLVPFFGMFFISYEVPMFHNRYLMHTFIGFVLLLSIASLSIVKFPYAKLSIPVILVFCFFLKSERNIDNGRHTKEAVAKVQELRNNDTRVVMYPKYRILGYSYYFNRDRFKNYDAEFGFYKVLEGFKEENFYGINQYSEARIDSSVNEVIFMMTDGGPKDQLINDFKEKFSLTDSYNFPEIIDIYKFEKK